MVIPRETHWLLINGLSDRAHPELHQQEYGSSWFRISPTGHLIIKGEIQNEDHRYRQARTRARTGNNTASRKTGSTPDLGDVSQTDRSRILLIQRISSGRFRFARQENG